jgi:hypothetical protein
MADVIFGDVVPSGKLPHTMPKKPNEVGMTQSQYPGVPPTNATGNACAVGRPLPLPLPLPRLPLIVDTCVL